MTNRSSFEKKKNINKKLHACYFAMAAWLTSLMA